MTLDHHHLFKCLFSDEMYPYNGGYTNQSFDGDYDAYGASEKQDDSF